MPVTYITHGNSELKRLDCFRAAQRLISPMAGRPALRGRSDPFDNSGISRGHIIIYPTTYLSSPITTVVLVSSHFMYFTVDGSAFKSTHYLEEDLRFSFFYEMFLQSNIRIDGVLP